MKSESDDKELTDFIEEVEDRQRNIQWHDMLRNQAPVTRFIWHGSPEATTVQRIGLTIFGTCFLAFGLAIAIPALRGLEDKFILVVAAPFAYVGLRLIRRAFR